MKKKLIISRILGLVLIIFTMIFNPVGYNVVGNRQVVQALTGKLSIHFDPGMYWAGFFSKTHTYPDVITVAFAKEEQIIESEISVRKGPCTIRFNDAAEAYAEATVRWRLPMAETEMIHIHKEY